MEIMDKVQKARYANELTNTLEDLGDYKKSLDNHTIAYIGFRTPGVSMPVTIEIGQLKEMDTENFYAHGLDRVVKIFHDYIIQYLTDLEGEYIEAIDKIIK